MTAIAPTPVPIDTRGPILRDQWHRYTFEGTRYPGWTSIGKVIDKSEPLIIWSTRLAVMNVLDQLETIPAMLEHNDREEVIKLLAKRSAWDNKKAQERGTDIHAHAERIFRGEDVAKVLPDVAPEHQATVAGIAAWWASSGWRLRLTEGYVVNTTLGYGGGFDLLAYDEQGRTVLADVKTGKTYPEHRLQLLAYASAEWVTPAGSRLSYPMPKVDRHVVILAGETETEPIEITIEQADQDAFRACVPLAAWKKAHDKWAKA